MGGKAPGFILHPGVRVFRKADLGGIMRIEKASFDRDAWPRDLFLEYAQFTPKLFLVARAGPHVAGYIIAFPTRHGIEVASLAVLPRYRQVGIGRTLMRAAIRKARREGLHAVWLMVRRENEDAIRLYRKLGFVRVATVANYYSDGSAGWRMRMEA